MIPSQVLDISSQCNLQTKDSQQIQYRSPNSKRVILGALKTQIDRRVIKILTMLGQSCNLKEPKCSTAFNDQNQQIQTTAVLNKKTSIYKHSQISEENLLAESQNQSSKIISIFQPNDLEDNEVLSNQSETKKTIEEMSIYKIFGFTNKSNTDQDDLDNIFVVEKDEKDCKNNLITQTLNLNIAGNLQNIPKRNHQRSSNTDRQIKTHNITQYEKPNMSRKKDTYKDKENQVVEITSTYKKNFNNPSSMKSSKVKIAIKDILERNGHQATTRNSIKNSPPKKQANQNGIRTSRSSVRRLTFRNSTAKKDHPLRTPIVSDCILREMQELIMSVKDKKIRKQSNDNNVRSNMIKRIEAKYPQIIKPKSTQEMM